MAVFSKLQWKQVLTHVGIGMASASFWRGAWYVLDDQLFPESPATSAAASLALGTAGMAASQGLVQKSEQWALQLKNARNCSTTRTMQLKLARFGALYSIAVSCVLVWRGTWMLWDVCYERWSGESPTSPVHATHSGVLSHGFAAVCLLGGGFFASVLAPPAAASVIQDLAVKAGQGKYAAGPAGRVAQHLWKGGTTATTTTSATATGKPLSRALHHSTTTSSTSQHSLPSSGRRRPSMPSSYPRFKPNKAT